MKNVTVARRYARAVYQLAVEAKGLDDVLQGMNNIVLAQKESPAFAKILLNPLIKAEEKSTLLKEITSNKLILKFVAVLAKRRRLDLFGVIFDELQRLSDKSKGIHRVLVKTASGLTDDQKKAVEKTLAGALSGEVFGKFEIAKELIGGMWVKLGDKVLDVSVRGRFEDLRHTLAHSAN